MIDTHCHLNFKAFSDDAEAVATNMAKEDISAVVVGCDEVTSRVAINLAKSQPNLWAAVGLHPTHVLDTPWNDTLMKELALEDRVVAIGEVGLDWFRFPDNEADKQRYIDAQYIALHKAIYLAKQLNKPLILHSRNAYDDLLGVIEKEFVSDDKLKGTIHCFMGKWQQAQRFLNLGFMIGFTGVITHKTVDALLLEVVAKVPFDRILIETDSPYLTPEPYRSEGRKQTGSTPRNLPAYVIEVAKKIAELRSTDTENIIKLTEMNAQRLFRIGKG